jgi:hypothetical protein
VLCISLPIPIIVNNFNKFYEKAKIEEEIEVKRKKTSWEDAKRGMKHPCVVKYLSFKEISNILSIICENIYKNITLASSD